MENKLDVVGRGEIWEVLFQSEGETAETLVFHATATQGLGEKRHYSRWSLSGILARELERQGLGERATILRGLIRVYRRRFDLLLRETDPHRMLKIEHLSLFQRQRETEPLARVEREVEDLLYVMAQLLTRFPSGGTTLEVPTAEVEWTACEAQLRGLAAHRGLADFYQAYARLFRPDSTDDAAIAGAARRASRLGLMALHTLWSLSAPQVTLPPTTSRITPVR
jgi:hypothetical protein